MNNINTFVEIKTQFQALHNWPECNIKEVSYLKNIHRHLIYVNVKIQTYKDRGIEFFQLKENVDKIIEDLYSNNRTKLLGRKSMEEIAKDILKKLLIIYKETKYIIKVSEDNQVAGVIEYEYKR